MLLTLYTPGCTHTLWYIHALYTMVDLYTIVLYLYSVYHSIPWYPTSQVLSDCTTAHPAIPQHTYALMYVYHSISILHSTVCVHTTVCLDTEPL